MFRRQILGLSIFLLLFLMSCASFPGSSDRENGRSENLDLEKPEDFKSCLASFGLHYKMFSQGFFMYERPKSDAIIEGESQANFIYYPIIPRKMGTLHMDITVRQEYLNSFGNRLLKKFHVLVVDEVDTNYFQLQNLPEVLPDTSIQGALVPASEYLTEKEYQFLRLNMRWVDIDKIWLLFRNAKSIPKHLKFTGPRESVLKAATVREAPTTVYTVKDMEFTLIPQNLPRGILEPFYIAKYETTQEQWQEIMGQNPSFYPMKGHPVENVSYDEVIRFIEKLNQKTGKKFYLPSKTELMWAGQGIMRPSVDPQLEQRAWFKENSGNHTHHVGTKQRSLSFDLHDILGNVHEMVRFDGEKHTAIFSAFNSSFEWSSFKVSLSLDPVEGRKDTGFRLAHPWNASEEEKTEAEKALARLQEIDKQFLKDLSYQ